MRTPENKGWGAVDAFIEAKLIDSGEDLSSVINRNRLEGLPPIDVSAAQGKMLMLMATMAGANRILEIGTLGGYSTIWLARALPNSGSLVTLELVDHHAQVAAKNLYEHGLSARVSILQGSASESLDTMIRLKEEPFDFVFVDADKGGYCEYFDKVMELVTPGATLVFDNVVRRGSVIEENPTDKSGLGVRALIEKISTDGRVSATAVQTVGAKGWDGFLLARVL